MKRIIAAVVVAAATTTASAQSNVGTPEFPNFALGYWRLNGGGSTSYVIEGEFLKDRAVYRTQISGEPPCIYDVTAGEQPGEYRYIYKEGGGDCNAGAFTLHARDDGKLNLKWKRPGAGGTHVLSPDAEKMREYRQASGLSKPVLETAEIEGEWTGELVVGGMVRSLEASLAATASGARLELNGLTVRCKTMIHPTSADGTFDTFLYEKGSCSESPVALQKVGDDLEMTIATTGQSAMLKKVSGPVGSALVNFAPIAFRNVALGMSLDEIDRAVEGEPRITTTRNLSDDLHAGSFMGVGNIPFLNADYRAVHYPLTNDRYPPEMDEDNIAAYAIGGKVAAIFRVYTPVRENAPGLDAFKEAVRNAYGEPSIESVQNARTEWQWHYAPDGSLLPDQFARAACVAKGNSTHANSRQIGMRYRWYERMMDLSIRKQNETPAYMLRPVSGCGTSVSFVLTAGNDGSLRELRSVAFVHDPVATALWEERKPRIEAEIRDRIQLQTHRESIAPKL